MHLVRGSQDPEVPRVDNEEGNGGERGEVGHDGAWLTEVTCRFCGFSGCGRVSALLWPGPF